MKNVVPGGKMVKIYIDNKEYEADDSKNLLEVMVSLGLDIPYFCWHPAMGSVGACRQCAVVKYRDENDTRGKIIMSCMEPVRENLRISFSGDKAVNFRRGIIEWLMTNHPHDCPVCDEGGECHLQDMTVMTGHTYRRFRFDKRTHLNQDLGPFINHEMNRCIQCYRCVRFYRNYAGGRDLDVFSAHDHVYFGRHSDGVLENEFSGNLVEVCPTGVFTDKTLKKHYTRKWDLSGAPSVCPHCSVGCNIIAGERYGMLRRILTRYNGQVNGYFMCDRGRFGYEFVNDEKRIRNIFQINRQTGERSYPSLEEVLKEINQSLKGKITGIGSPRASLESNYALQKLVSPENFFAGESRQIFDLVKTIIFHLKKYNIKTPSLKEIEDCDAVFILGEDITNTAPMMALAVRQAAKKQPQKKAAEMKIPAWQDDAVRTLVQDAHGPVFIATPYPVKLNDIATEIITDTPEKLADFGFELTRWINRDSSEKKEQSLQKEQIKRVADALKTAERPLIISGTSCMNENIINAAFHLAGALHKVNENTMLSFAVPECNSMGLAMLAEKDLDDLISGSKQNETLIILENDLYRRKDKKEIDHLLSTFKNIIVLDHLENETVNKADTVIPAGTYAESDGTYINNEGRAQRFYQVFLPEEPVKESWRWIDIMAHAGTDKEPLKNFDEQVKELTDSHPQFRGIEKLTPPASFRIAGQKIPRQPERYTGRTAMHAQTDVSEQRPAQDKDSPLSFSMEGFRGEPPSSIIPYFRSPGWNSAQAINKYQIEVGGALHDGDPGLRLIEPSSLPYPEYPERKSATKSSSFIMVPVYHIFGSEELSSYSPAIKELSPDVPFAFMNQNIADELNRNEGDDVIITTEKNEWKLKIKIKKEIPGRIIGISSGITDFYFDFKQKIENLR